MGIMPTISVIVIAQGRLSHPEFQTLSNGTPNTQPAIAIEGFNPVAKRIWGFRVHRVLGCKAQDSRVKRPQVLVSTAHCKNPRPLNPKPLNPKP